MIKRLLITMEYLPDHGGIATYYSGLVDALPAGSVQVMTPRTHRFFVRWLWPHWLPLFWNAWRTIRREKPTEVWVGQILPIGTAIFLLKTLRLIAYRLPLTLFCHGMDILVPQQSHWKTWLIKQILASADRVITSSEYTMKEVMKLGVSKEKVVVVYPCPHRDIGRLNLPTEVQPPVIGNKRILLTVARLVQRKGIDLVIEALRHVVREIPDVQYVILGDGPEKEKLASLVTSYAASGRHPAKGGGQLPVTFLGSVSAAERTAWYDACDIFIMTPRQIGGDVEGFGLVYLEAALHGKPVIGSRSGGVPEAVIDDQTGILVPENNVDAIAQAITRLLTDKDFADRLGTHGKQRVEKEFLWSKQIQKLA